MERYRPVRPFEMPAPNDDDHDDDHEERGGGGVFSTSVELTQAVSKKISRTKYSDTVSALTRYAQSPVSEHGDDGQPSTRTRRFKGLLEGIDPSGSVRYIDETVTAHPGGVLIRARGVRNEKSDPESEALNSEKDVGGYHVAVGLANYTRAIIVNVIDTTIMNRIRREILKEMQSGKYAPFDVLYHLVEEKYKGVKAPGSGSPLLLWARTNRPDKHMDTYIEDEETQRIL